MRLLLDTHLLLWALSDPRRIGREGLALIDRADVSVSAASIWEISIKSAQGKLKVNPETVLQAVEPAGFSMLPIKGEHAARVFDLGMHHNDPFDRLLVAQAQLESMTLLTNDEALTPYGSCVRVL
jgi:PIN domain nuclease of toxin-antitoxin system